MNRIERNPMIWDNEEAERQLEALYALKHDEAVRRPAIHPWWFVALFVVIIVAITLWWAR
jgi:hypothetical protein